MTIEDKKLTKAGKILSAKNTAIDRLEIARKTARERGLVSHFASIGGKARMAQLTKEQRSALARKAAFASHSAEATKKRIENRKKIK
jgi:diacylglycerol kinase family enzyme